MEEDSLTLPGPSRFFPFNASLAQSGPVRNLVSADLQSTGPVVLIALLCNHT